MIAGSVTKRRKKDEGSDGGEGGSQEEPFISSDRSSYSDGGLLYNIDPQAAATF